MTEPHDSVRDPKERHGSAHDVPAGLRPPPRPRWVIWLAIAIAAAVLVFLGVHLLMGGHGPMQHVPGTNHGLPASARHGGLSGDVA